MKLLSVHILSYDFPLRAEKVCVMCLKT